MVIKEILMEHISRPPFDENGYAVYEGQSKKKKSTPLRWIIPAGLLAIVACIVIILCLRPKDVNPFCRKALKNAISDSFGTGDPMVRRLGFGDVREYMMGGNYELGTTISVQSVEAKEGTALFGLLDQIGLKPEDVPKGVGLGFTIEALEGKGAYENLSLAVSMIKLVLLRAWNDRESVTIASQRLHEDGLKFDYGKVLGSWKDNAAWSLVPADKRDGIKNQVQEILTSYKISSIISRLTKGTSPLSYFGSGYESAANALLRAISFEEAKNASGQRLQKKIHVGKENLLCYGYHAYIDTDEICKRLRTFTGISEKNLHYAKDAERIDALMFLTRKGEVISLEFSTELVIYGENIPLTLTYGASGERDPQDHFVMSLDLQMQNPVTVSFTKNTTQNAYGIRSTLDAEVEISGKKYSASLLSDCKDGGDIVTIEANTYVDGGSVGGLQAEAQVRAEEKECSLNFRKLRLWDTYTGTAVNLTWKINAGVKEDDTFSAKAPEVIHDVTEMTQEEWEAFYEKVKHNLDDYIDTLTDLI